MGYNSVADMIGLSSFVQPWLPPKAKSCEIPTKFDFTAVQGHPRSSILVSIESPCTTSYQSLIVTLAVSSTVFEILTLKARKSLNFSDRPLFEAPVRGNPLEFGDEIWGQKTGVLGLSDGGEIMPLAFLVLTQYRRVTDGRTDGRTRCDRYYPRQHSVARVTRPTHYSNKRPKYCKRGFNLPTESVSQNLISSSLSLSYLQQSNFQR